MTVKVGLALPQGSTGELGGTAPAGIAATVTSFARRAEELGFDSIWVSDHFTPTRKSDKGGLLEGWTLLAVLSQVTSRVSLGQLVLCSAFRNPALLAKMGATLDVLSGGRLVLGLGAGWHRTEFERYGYPFLEPGQRIGQLRETLEIVRLMWSDDRSTYTGTHFRVDKAVCEPKPLQALPPILVGGMGDSTLKLAARLADLANFFGPVDKFVDASGRLDRQCEKVGRDPAGVERTWMTIGVHVAESESDARRDLEGWREAGDVRFDRCQISGSPDQVVDALAPYVEAGCGTLILTPSTSPGLRALDLLGVSVLPELRAL